MMHKSFVTLLFLTFGAIGCCCASEHEYLVCESLVFDKVIASGGGYFLTRRDQPGMTTLTMVKEGRGRKPGEVCWQRNVFIQHEYIEGIGIRRLRESGLYPELVERLEILSDRHERIREVYGFSNVIDENTAISADDKGFYMDFFNRHVRLSPSIPGSIFSEEDRLFNAIDKEGSAAFALPKHVDAGIVEQGVLQPKKEVCHKEEGESKRNERQSQHHVASCKEEEILPKRNREGSLNAAKDENNGHRFPGETSGNRLLCDRESGTPERREVDAVVESSQVPDVRCSCLRPVLADIGSSKEDVSSERPPMKVLTSISTVRASVDKQQILTREFDVLSPIKEKQGGYVLVEARKSFVRCGKDLVNMRLDNVPSGTREFEIRSEKNTASGRENIFMLKTPTSFVLGRWYHTMVSLPKGMFAADRVERIYIP